MKALVVGVGSIGTRHAKNLALLGHEIYATDINDENLKQIAPFVNGTFNSLSEALKSKPDVTFICTFSNDHIATAIECARTGSHLFIEKPLSISLAGIDELIEIIDKNRLISMVGCNMRFHPALLYIHDILTTNPFFSKKLWGNFEFGFYLPFDKKDYHLHYKANKRLGGNLIFDDIHDLDCAVWFLGEPTEVLCNKGIISSLKIDTEDHVEMIIKYASGSTCTIHMDYLQHGYSKRCKIVCEGGTIVWDFTNGKIGMITTADGKWSWTDMKVEIHYNQMYMDEIKYFLECVSSQKETFNSVIQSLSVLKLAIKANESCQSNKWEKV